MTSPGPASSPKEGSMHAMQGQRKDGPVWRPVDGQSGEAQGERAPFTTHRTTARGAEGGHQGPRPWKDEEQDSQGCCHDQENLEGGTAGGSSAEGPGFPAHQVPLGCQPDLGACVKPGILMLPGDGQGQPTNCMKKAAGSRGYRGTEGHSQTLLGTPHRMTV